MGGTGRRWGIGKGQPIPENQKVRGHGGRHEAGVPAHSGSLRATHSAAKEGLLGLLKVCKKMSWRAQQARCWGLGPGPKAQGWADETDGVDADMERGPDTELREKTDRHAETLQSREAAFPDPSAADQSGAASHPYPAQAALAPSRPHPSPRPQPHLDPICSLTSRCPPRTSYLTT